MGGAEATKTTKFQCDICFKFLATKQIYTRHRRIHTGEKTCKCDYCGKEFGDKSDLSRHLKIHTGEKNYVCSTCNKAFTQKSQLDRHARIHTGERPHPCKICEKPFMSTGDLRKHMKVHTDERPYSCDVCGKSYKHHHALGYHKARCLSSISFKSKAELNSCDICGKSYKYPSALESHKIKCTALMEQIKNAAALHSAAYISQMIKQEIMDEDETGNDLNPFEFVKSELCGESAEAGVEAEGKTVSNEVDTSRFFFKIMPKQPKLTCALCSQSFKKTIELRRHMKTHNKNSQIVEATPSDANVDGDNLNDEIPADFVECDMIIKTEIKEELSDED